MKNFYIALLFLCFATISQAQIINFPDANLKAKLLAASPPTFTIARDIDNNFITIDSNADGEIQVSEALQVYALNLNGLYYSASEKISNLTGIEAFTNLRNLECSYNTLTTLNVSALTNLIYFNCNYNALTSLNINGLTNLLQLNCRSNNLASIDFSQLPAVNDLVCDHNALTNVSINGLLNLKQLYLGNNALTYLNVVNCPQIYLLWCHDNHLTSLSLNQLPTLQSIYCQNNLITSLDIQNIPEVHDFEFSNNPQLVSVFMKNGFWQGIDNCAGLNSLRYICADDSEIENIQNALNYNNYTNCALNTYCSFTPGGQFYVIQGNQKFDIQNNGCDNSDIAFPNLKFSISNGTDSGTIISNTSGNYSLPVQAGTQTVTPMLENPAYFTATPSSFQVTFPTQSSPFTQNFCITPNGMHNDLEVMIIPLTAARPGFDAIYKIEYKNKGNSVLSGNVSLSFEDDKMDLVSATPIYTSQSFGQLSWDYINLQVFESRSIVVKMNINSPTETPPVNSGNVLNFTTIINPLVGDEFLYDNTKSLKQVVVNSMDPNDKTCVQGNSVGPDMIGAYVDYVIRFENTGTFAAENIVVKDMIDLTKFDISTLVPTGSSHDFVTRINGNKVEFVFENINLPFDDASNDGYVAFKIKTKPTLVIGDTFTNAASIYFDYNLPVVTNTATTTIQALSNQDFEFADYFILFPNPAHDILNIQTKNAIELKSISVYNILGQLVLIYPNVSQGNTIDISNLKAGSYLIRFVTDKGITSSKFVKK